ncbi:MAG TPA: FkbM family methyltransferase [Bryobacteraceae bacterium]|nr:FkbM family methyltransferase [Bryobacteraceae bacterium]
MSRSSKFLASIVVLAAGIAAGYSYTPARLFAIKALGRAPQCPMSNALAAQDNIKLQIRYKDEILAASRLIEKDPAGFHLWETPMGRWWIPDGDDWMLPYNLAEQKRRIYGTGPQDVQRGDVVLDCGANIGVYTRLALDRGARTVVAIEPGPENVESLRRNFKDEIASGRVILVPKGVWDKDDILTLKVDPGNTAANTFVMDLKNGQMGVKVPLTTIDKLVAELGLDKVDYIKMDIEGAEQRALQGAAGTLAKYHPRLALSAYHVPDDPVKIPELVRKAWPGYGMECGPCAEATFLIRPDVLYFR